MRTYKAMAGLVAVALMLAGCGGTAAAPKPSTTEAPAARTTSFEDERQAVNGYLGSDVLLNISRANDKIGELIDAVASGDAETATKLNSDISALANELIEFKNVPAPAEDVHQEIVDAAKSYRDCSDLFTQAAATDDVSKANDLIAQANLKLKDAQSHVEMATSKIKGLRSEYDLKK